MEHDDTKYADMLNEELKGVEPGTELQAKVRGRIAGAVLRTHRRNAALGLVSAVIIVTMTLSAVTPVFGRNGTLSQVITALTAEHQAQSVSRSLGTTSVEQTSAALLVPEAAIQSVTASSLSETDSILALVIADCSGKPVEDVVQMRTTDGLGWGIIMDQLGVSGREIGNAMNQAQSVASASGTAAGTSSQTPPTAAAPALSNKNGDKVVASGEIALVPPVSQTSLTVAGKTFAVVAGTQMKYHGKPITTDEILAKRTAGMLYATVQGTKLADGSLIANLIIVQDALGDAERQQTQEQTQEQTQQQTQQQAGRPASNDQQVRGKVTAVSPALLRVDGFASDILLNAATKVEQVGAGTADLSFIKVGQTVQVHVITSGTTVTAQQVHIEDKYVKVATPPVIAPATPSSENQEQNQSKVSNDQQVRGKVTAVSPTLLRVDGFASDILLNAATKVEQVGAGTADLTFIKVGQTVRVHVITSGTTVTAQQVHIEDKYVKASTGSQQTDPAVKTWQGTIANVVAQPSVNGAGESALGVVLLSEQGQPSVFWVLSTSVLQDAGSHAVTLAELQALPNLAMQKVTIQGKLLADGSVDIVKLVLTTGGTTSQPENPGKGNGKH